MKSVSDTDKKPTDKTLMWGLSSAGRAAALQAEGHRFESYCSHQRVKVLYLCPFYYADVAHLVERHLAKVEVAGSSPVIRSKKH